MKNIYFNSTNLYLVKPSVMTNDNYGDLEQRIEDIDIAFKEDNHYFSIFNNREYLSYSKNIEFDKYYIDVNEEDKILLIRYLYENEKPLEDKEIEHIQSLLKYFDLNELSNFLSELKSEANVRTKK